MLRCHPEKGICGPARYALAAVFALAVMLAGGAATKAGVISASAVLDSGQEVPPGFSDASGRADFSYDSDSGTYSFELRVSGITLTDITFPDGNGLAFGAAGPVHLHNAARGANGPIVAPFNDRVLYSEDGDGFRLRSFGPLDSLVTGLTTEAFLNRLALEGLYVNVHSFPNFPAGEIRGQLVVIAEPAGFALLGFGLALLLLARVVRRGFSFRRVSPRLISVVRRKLALPGRR